MKRTQSDSIYKNGLVVWIDDNKAEVRLYNNLYRLYATNPKTGILLAICVKKP